MHQNLLVSQTQSSKSAKASNQTRLTRKDRLFRVQVGVAAGRSNRQIAKHLGVDEGTVRRDRLTLLLSREEVQAVRAGAPVEPLLRKQERRKAATVREKHEAAERESQFLSNRLAKWIDRWLTQFTMAPANKLHVIRGVDPWSWQFQTPKGICMQDSKIGSTIERVKPKANYLEETFAVIEFAKEWLIRWIVVVEPDRDIRDRALTRIRQYLERQTPYC